MAFSVTIATTTVAFAENIDIHNSTNTFTVTDQGKVTIGGVDPWVAIYAKGNSPYGVQMVSHYSGTNNLGGGGFLAYHNNDYDGLPKNGDRLGYLLFGSKTGTLPLNSAGVEAHAEGDWNVTSDSKNIPTYLSFQTTDFTPYPLPLNGPYTRTERLRITAAGDIGIGTSTPETRLHVVKDVTSGGSIAFLDGYGGMGDINGPNIAVRASRGTVTSPLPTLKNDIVGQVNFRGRGPSGFASIRRAGVLAYAAEDYSDTAQGTMLAFATTANNSTTPINKVIIDGDGNVGIGAAIDPAGLSQKLEVDGGVRLIPQSSPQPNCDNEKARGTIWVVKDDINGDRIQVCVKVKSQTGDLQWETVTLNRSN